MGVVLVGLGCGGWPQLTLEAKEALEAAGEVCLRTRRHPVVARLPSHLRVRSLDRALREDPLPQALAERLMPLARRPQGLLYATPGHPLSGDAIAAGLLARCQGEGIPARALAGVGLAEPALAGMGLGGEGAQVRDALDRDLDPARPVLLCHLHPASLPRLKARLMERYPPEHPATLISLDGGLGLARSLSLTHLERLPRGTSTHCLYLPPGAPSPFEAFAHIIARLRGPGGCPWDREQTHASLKPFLIEEAYEVLEALDQGEPARLREELGDLLLQIALHAQMASEAGEFDLRGVLSAITQKLVRRHPHVFGGEPASGPAQVIAHWEELKARERGEGGSMLASVPKGMPALAYSQALQRRASRVGFEWGDFRGILDKIAEEVGEVQGAGEPEQRLREFGDLLFALADAARWMGVDLEEALRQASLRFSRRFSHMEQACRHRGVSLASLSPEGQSALWEEAKREWP